MDLKVDFNGKYYFLPLVGRTMEEHPDEGFSTLIFPDEDYEMTLKLDGDFRVVYQDQEELYNPYDAVREAILSTFSNVPITEAKADQYGILFISFEDGRQLIVDDGPFENWHFYVRNKRNGRQMIHLGGGIGQTFLFTW